ncbi:MAG: glycosyltransferase [Flavobacterium sp.]
MILLLVIVLSIYSITFLYLFWACFFVKTNFIKQPQNFNFSILIPFRNEAENLSKLLESIQELNYDFSKFEVILIDDNEYKSTINFQQFNFQYRHISNIRTTQSPKKDALTIGIEMAKFPNIITVDADCVVPNDWLQNYNNYLSQNIEKELVIGQVQIKNNPSLLATFQSIEFDVLQAITMGSYAVNHAFMCNGANLCFSKNIFMKVNGYQGNTNIASGDDVFLLQKVMNLNPKLVGFNLSTNKVITNPVKTWKLLFNQRLRWASKTVAYQSIFAKYIAILVFVTQLFTIISILYLFFFDFNEVLFSTLILKFTTQLLLLFKIQKIKLKTIIYAYLFEIYYLIFSVIIALASITKPKNKWK